MALTFESNGIEPVFMHVERFGPIFTDELRAKRKGKIGQIWHVDETYVKFKGRWCYLYRAMDQQGNLVDSRLA